MNPTKRLAELGLSLPPMSKPVANYVPAVRSGRHVFTSGQVPIREGKIVYAGKVPKDLSIDDAVKACEMAAMNGLAAIDQLIGGLDHIERVVRVCVYVNSAPGFTEQPKVANGVSDLLVKIFGDQGRHARAAVGVAELPLNAAVEVELLVEAAGT